MINAIRNSKLINWPNTLTIIRIFIALAIPWLLFQAATGPRLLAGVLFFIASVTDYIDGQLARRYNTITNLGKMLDPIADKLLVLGTLTTLAILIPFNIIWVLPILIREITITVLRMYFLTQNAVVASVKSGKQKMAFQLFTITVIYVNLMYQTSIYNSLSPALGDTLGTIITITMYLFLTIAVYLTVQSGIIFFQNNWHLLTPQRN
ncbi:MAG TPA: CDP-diacylglycerol--glycerol-3-phosphate 3-phosphatidyltransferase [Anaerolineae bacterium]|nr:CDP-diacylglycerol--glycerol-3-phosphate 3-phosphatidyltransferase [Anaerolineae bacterium]